tara:strand:+ start:241 stop:381 length:141 start_codon:yes stop_codon:yes gene_type:complete
MITKIGKNLDWQQPTLSQTLNLHWCASYTQNITSIHFTSPAPAAQK